MRALIPVLFVAAGVSLSAVTVTPLTFEQLVDASTAVVHGRVVDVRGQWSPDRRGIESLVAVDAIGYLKGDLGRRVIVRVPGGEAGGLINVIPGAPRFTTGDHVVVFLTATGPGIPVVTGTTQGVFRVITEPRTGAALVVPPVVPAAGSTGRLVRGERDRRPVALDAFALAVAREVSR